MFSDDSLKLRLHCRLPAFTLSTIKSHKDPWRSTILDNTENLDVDRLVRNAKIVVDAVGRYVYDISEGGIFGGSWVCPIKMSTKCKFIRWFFIGR